MGQGLVRHIKTLDFLSGLWGLNEVLAQVIWDLDQSFSSQCRDWMAGSKLEAETDEKADAATLARKEGYLLEGA